MVLYRISDRYPNYQNIYFDGGDLKGMILYSSENVKVGTVTDLLVDDSDRLKYLVVQLHQTDRKANITANSQKQVLVPTVSCARTTDENSLIARSLTSAEIYGLKPHENAAHSTEQTVSRTEDASIKISEDRHISAPQSVIPLYEERLSTRKQRVKTGEVKISKRIVTEKTKTSTPIKKEKIVIEIESIYGGETQIAVDDAEVAEDGSISMGIYEERAEVCRQVLPYRSVNVRKEIIQDVVKTTEELRREELSVNPEGLSYVDWKDS